VDAGEGEAFALARERQWIPSGAEAHTPIRLGELSYLIMRAYNLEGSVFFALFPGPRYAFRELDYRRLIPGRRDPGLPVSGEQLLQILSKVVGYLGEEEVSL
jgi:hypothetical protein